MAIEAVRRVFIYVVLGAATLLATLAASSRSTALRPAWCGDGPRRAVEEEWIVCLICGTRFRRRLIVADPELRRRGGMRPVTLEELLTRRDARRAAGRGAP